jgi:hypothetical protein
VYVSAEYYIHRTLRVDARRDADVSVGGVGAAEDGACGHGIGRAWTRLYTKKISGADVQLQCLSTTRLPQSLRMPRIPADLRSDRRIVEMVYRAQGRN